MCLFSHTACDDDCTGVLLDDLDVLHNHFLSVNLSSLAVAPYRQLVLLENHTREIQVQTHKNTALVLVFCPVNQMMFYC